MRTAETPKLRRPARPRPRSSLLAFAAHVRVQVAAVAAAIVLLTLFAPGVAWPLG